MGKNQKVGICTRLIFMCRYDCPSLKFGHILHCFSPITLLPHLEMPVRHTIDTLQGFIRETCNNCVKMNSWSKHQMQSNINNFINDLIRSHALVKLLTKTSYQSILAQEPI